MAEETVRVDPEEDLDSLIARLKQARSKDVMLALPNKTRALQTLDNFYALRKSAHDDGLNLTFSGGNKTMKGLARLLGFQVEGGDGSSVAEEMAGLKRRVRELERELTALRQKQAQSESSDLLA